MTESLVPLSVEERDDLKACETLISRGLTHFVDVGNALLTVRDKKLYRSEFATFEDYCRERWQIGRSHSYRLISAAEVAQDIPELQYERQARELALLSSELRIIAFDIAKGLAPDGEPTAGLLKMVSEETGAEVSVAIQTGAMDDGEAERPLATVLKANVTERVRERMLRQQEHVKSKIREKTERAIENGKQADVPAQPANFILMTLVRDLLKGIDRMNIDRQTKLHPALHAPYHLGKALIGEPLGEVSVLIDDVGTIGGQCDSCSDKEIELRDVALTTDIGGSLRSTRMKLCGHCLGTYSQVSAAAGAEVSV